MELNVTAFADEFGNNSFDFDKQGSHFIVATVICKNENLAKLESDIDLIRKKHKFQKGEIKSSKVGPNHARRKNILADIADLEMSVYAVVVNKKELYGKGFGYKKSFYKYLNNLLYKELFRTFPRLDLHVDEYGGNDFMREFRKYVEKNHIRNLFSGYDFIIHNSKANRFIQLADFIAGTLGYIFDETKKSEHSKDFEDLLRPKISGLNFFPTELSFGELLESNLDKTFDKQIAELSFLRIRSFLDTETGTDQQKVDQINFLNLLLLYQRASAKNKYITTKEIFRHLNQSRPEELKEEYFRSKVVGSLRDHGILIASSREGYKIPTSSKDLNNFIKHGKRIILPMLNRIKETRNAIKLATANEIDLLDGEDFKELKKLLDI